MQDVFWIMLMFTGAASGVMLQNPVVCELTKSTQCSVDVEQQLHLEVPRDSNFNLKITDRTSTTREIIKYRKQATNNTPKDPRWQFKDKKTMILTSAETRDSGAYTLETIHGNGTIKCTYYLQLNVKGGPPENLLVIVLSLVCVLLFVLSGLAFYIYKKRQGLRDKEARPQTEAVEYVTVITGPSQSNQKKKEEEVQYGELVFNAPAEKKSEMPKVQEECVYSQVQHGQ